MENENEYENGDLEAGSEDADTEARDPTGSGDSEAGDDESDTENANEYPPPRMPTPPVAASNSS